MSSPRRYTDAELEGIAEEFLAKNGQYDGCSLRVENVIERLGYFIDTRPGLAEFAEAFLPVDGMLDTFLEQNAVD